MNSLWINLTDVLISVTVSWTWSNTLIWCSGFKLLFFFVFLVFEQKLKRSAAKDHFLFDFCYLSVIRQVCDIHLNNKVQCNHICFLPVIELCWVWTVVIVTLHTDTVIIIIIVVVVVVVSAAGGSTGCRYLCNINFTMFLGSAHTVEFFHNKSSFY